MAKAYTQILIEDDVLKVFRNLKTKNSYSAEIREFLGIKKKVLNNERVNKDDLNKLK